MAMAPTNMPMELSTWVSGVRTNSTEGVLKSGQMVRSMKDATKTVKSMVTESSLLQTGPPIQDSSRIMKFQDLESMYGPTTKFTKAYGSATKCMVRALCSGRTVSVMRVSS